MGHALLFSSCKHTAEDKVFVVAHRGGIIDGYPENTLVAFQRCIELGVDAIEVDLRTTGDQAIVIMHDKTLDRTTNGTGRLNSYTLLDVKQLDAGNGNTIPTFEELLELVKGTKVKLLLDLKESEQWYKEAIYNLLIKHDMLSQIIIGARSLEDVTFFRESDENLLILGFIPDQNMASSFISAGINFIRLWPESVMENPGMVSFITEQNIPVWSTTGNMRHEELTLLYNHGVRGFIHDNPEKLLKDQYYQTKK